MPGQAGHCLPSSLSRFRGWLISEGCLGLVTWDWQVSGLAHLWGDGEEAGALLQGSMSSAVCPALVNRTGTTALISTPAPLRSCLTTANPRLHHTGLSRLLAVHNPPWLPSTLRIRRQPRGPACGATAARLLVHLPRASAMQPLCQDPPPGSHPWWGQPLQGTSHLPSSLPTPGPTLTPGQAPWSLPIPSRLRGQVAIGRPHGGHLQNTEAPHTKIANTMVWKSSILFNMEDPEAHLLPGTGDKPPPTKL